MPAARKKRARRPIAEDLFDAVDHEDPMAALVARALEHPQIQGVVLQVQDVLDSFGFVIDRAARRPTPERPRRPATPPPVRSTPRDPLADARATLHFGPTDKLSKEIVRKRRKELAAMVHPDRGGSDEAMRKINAAADALLAVI